MAIPKLETATDAAEDDKIYGSVDELLADGASEIEYATVEGFKPGTKIRIGSVTAGDMIVWSEANGTEAKRTAGLRLICQSLVDANGNRYAADDRNIAKFRLMRHKVTERVVKEILKLNGMTVKQDTEAKND